MRERLRSQRTANFQESFAGKEGESPAHSIAHTHARRKESLEMRGKCCRRKVLEKTEEHRIMGMGGMDQARKDMRNLEIKVYTGKIFEKEKSKIKAFSNLFIEI